MSLRAADSVEQTLRSLAPRVLGTLTRRYGRFDLCEDAVQEALVAAALQWPEQGVPDHPSAWLLTVASRRLTDLLRSEHSRRAREDAVALMEPPGATDVETGSGDEDDTLTLLLLCCHPALSETSQTALTLRAVGGLSTAEIARAFLVPEATMAQRISRAKQQIKRSGIPFEIPPDGHLPERLRVVCHVLYLIFNEGYTATSGPSLHRAELTREAIRLARELRRHLPDDGEVAGLLALMLLTEARRPARTTPDGALVPLAEQDRRLWDADAIAEGTSLVSAALAEHELGPYQLQAAIAAVHAEAGHHDDTDWRQIVALYALLARISPSPVVTLNHAVALAMTEGPRAGLDLLTTLDGDEHLTITHRLEAVRAHLLELAGDRAAARDGYLEAVRQTTSIPEKRYLEARAEGLSAAS